MTDAPKRTPKSWTHYLADEDNPVTLDEYVAGCTSRILGCLIEIAAATGHTEGMVGSLDDLMAETNHLYRAIAAKRGTPRTGMLPEGG